jgi:epimerase transport system membrane fusion protein
MQQGGDQDMLVEMESQLLIFNARKIAHEGREQMLRIMQLRSRLTGLRAQLDSQRELMQSYAIELDEVRTLLADGFSDSTRLRSVERSYTAARGEVAQLASDIEGTEMQIAETEMEILQHQREFKSEVVTQLGETQSRLKDLREQHRALDDVVVRRVIRAPDSGVVDGLEVHTIGGVVAPGQPIAEIVPEGDELIIESRVSPLDIDRVAVGQLASVRFSSFSAQTTPNLSGQVIHVAADAVHDETTGQSHYLTRISVEPSELAKLGDVQLVPGMPAEVFISSGARTLLQYLFKPLSNAIARSFIED